MAVYHNEFAETGWSDVPEGWARVQHEFQTDYPEPSEVLYADYECENYEGSAHVLWREPTGEIKYVNGDHCSCYGLEDQWDIETYSEETVRQMIDRAREGANKWQRTVFGLPCDELERLLNNKKE